MKINDQLKIAIAVSRFNESYTDKLLAGALDTLSKNGLNKNQIDVVSVPGAFELPLACKKLALRNVYSAIIALGAVIRGETYHFEIVCETSAIGLMQVSLETGVPVINGIITTENEDQAEARVGGAEGNKGSDAAIAALNMIQVIQSLRK